MATDLARAYRACARIARRRARNFYFAFLSLPRPQRRAVYALYAFCCEADGVMDDSVPPSSITKENGQAILPVRSADARPTVPPSSIMPSSITKKNAQAILPVRSANARPTVPPSSITPSSITPSSTTNESEGPGDVAARRARIEAMRERLDASARGAPRTERDHALAHAIARFGVSADDLRDVLAGIEMDLAPTPIATYDELRTYCYHVASAVGLATLPILTDGAPPTPAMRDAAIDLGLGMQFVNILRDVDEDLGLGRIYLPTDPLAAHGIDADALRSRRMSDPLRAVLASHADRARALLDSGRHLLPMLPRRSRACPWLLSEIYGRILRRIAEADYAVFDGRVSLPALEKGWLLLSARWRRW